MRGRLTKEGEEIHDTQEGNDTKVNLGNKFALRRMRRALDSAIIIVDGFVRASRLLGVSPLW